MAGTAIQNTSIALYRYMCQNIVGTEDYVKTLRMMNTVKDHLISNNFQTTVTSGSFGEGLAMRGSDLDIMEINFITEVLEVPNTFYNYKNISFTIATEDTQPGYTYLRLLQPYIKSEFLRFCIQIGDGYFLSNVRIKQHFSNKYCPSVHGPCLSDKNGYYDIAICLRSKTWITPANGWLTRSKNSWPGYDIKQTIAKHGTLFVPIGVKGSKQEELEWRISFSIGEKLLINTFKHSQLLCYALLKILLKDVIALDLDCRDLICSYFMKTVLFWICEELPPSIRKPKNLISCYMRCFRRLLYCVEYSVCPHYFIPENNLFNNKIRGHARQLLCNRLKFLDNYGWQCILLSDQISNFHASSFDIINEPRCLPVYNIKQLYPSLMCRAEDWEPCFEFLGKVVHKVLFIKSSKIKSMYTYYMSKLCNRYVENHIFLPMEDISDNKLTYKQYNTYVSHLLLNTHHDAVSGWLVLASYFYKIKQYNKTIVILKYCLSKCSPEKLQQAMNFSQIHYDLLNLHLFRKMTVVQLRQFLIVDRVRFYSSLFMPDELGIDKTEMGGGLIPPVVYAHFLLFLTHFNLGNTRQCRDSLRYLRLTIEELYFIKIRYEAGMSYYILGVSCLLVGDIQSARLAFMKSIELLPDQDLNNASRILASIS